MVLNAQKVHAADLGGSKGESEAKNLLDVVKTLVLGMGLTLVFGPNEHGNWGGQLIDLAKGMASAIPLNEDMLPCLQLDGGLNYRTCRCRTASASWQLCSPRRTRSEHSSSVVDHT